MKAKLDIFRGDKVIWMIVLVLSIASVLAVYSSTKSLAYKYHGGNMGYYLFKHIALQAFGIFLMFLAHNVKYTYYSRISQLAIYISIPLLALTLFTGTNLNEATRWLTVPVLNISIQTSDIAKLALIMYIARLLSKKQEQIKDLRSSFVPIMIPVLLTVSLILPANFSTAALLFVTVLVLLFIGRINMKYIAAMLGAGLLLLTILVAIAQFNPKILPRINTWKARVERFIDGETSEGDFQADQAKIAIARGHFFGVAPGNSLQKDFLPHPYSDFIYAIIIEEYGFLGGFVILFMYLILFYRVVRIATRSPGTYGAFLSVGLGFMLVFQALTNMGVTVNLLPVTGQPLPLVSMGGSSMWFTSLAVGIILSVSREIEPEPEEEEAEEELKNSVIENSN